MQSTCLRMLCIDAAMHMQSTRTSRRGSTTSARSTSPYSSTSATRPPLTHVQRVAHASHRVTKVYESETYDYPTQIQESLTELGTTIGHGITNFAAHNLKGVAPTPAPVTPPAAQHKTLPHAIGRAATTAAQPLQTRPGGGEEKLRTAIGAYAGAWEKIADARVTQDESIRAQFLQPWQTTLSTSIAVAMKARQAVRVSRLELDSAKQR